MNYIVQTCLSDPPSANATCSRFVLYEAGEIAGKVSVILFFNVGMQHRDVGFPWDCMVKIIKYPFLELNNLAL